MVRNGTPRILLLRSCSVVARRLVTLLSVRVSSAAACPPASPAQKRSDESLYVRSERRRPAASKASMTHTSSPMHRLGSRAEFSVKSMATRRTTKNMTTEKRSIEKARKRPDCPIVMTIVSVRLADDRTVGTARVVSSSEGSSGSSGVALGL